MRSGPRTRVNASIADSSASETIAGHCVDPAPDEDAAGSPPATVAASRPRSETGNVRLPQLHGILRPHSKRGLGVEDQNGCGSISTHGPAVQRIVTPESASSPPGAAAEVGRKATRPLPVFRTFRQLRRSAAGAPCGGETVAEVAVVAELEGVPVVEEIPRRHPRPTPAAPADHHAGCPRRRSRFNLSSEEPYALMCSCTDLWEPAAEQSPGRPGRENSFSCLTVTHSAAPRTKTPASAGRSPSGRPRTSADTPSAAAFRRRGGCRCRGR